MLSQEWATIRTVLHSPDGYITEGTQILTMRCLLICYSVGWLGMVWEFVIMVIECDQANDTKKTAIG